MLRGSRFDEERTHLQPLPSRRTNDFSEQYVKVSSSSTILVKCVTYTVPSRLISASLLIHIFDERLELFYGHESILTLPRVYAQAPQRARSIDYRHIIHSLAKNQTPSNVHNYAKIAFLMETLDCSGNS